LHLLQYGKSGITGVTSMKIVIFGLTISSSWGNGHATIWRGLCRVLAHRGHKVLFFEHDAPYYAANRDLAEIPGVDVRLYGSWEDVRHDAQRELADSDAGIVTSYCPDGIAASEIVLSADNVLHVFYDLDTPVTLAAVEEGRELAYIGPHGLRDFDLVLSYTGGSALELLKSRLGAQEVMPLYGCADPQTHHPVPPMETYTSLLSYLGTYSEDRQGAVEKFFVEPARRLPSERFALGGSMYSDNFPWLPNIWYFAHVPPALHPAFYCSSRFTLNVTRQVMARMGYCPSGRLFEAAACGVPIISDYWEGLEHFLTPGSEIITVNAAEDVLDALRMEDHQHDKIAAAARDRTLTEHSAQQRAKELENMLSVFKAKVH
jgi:spore maturation protein CgeB